MAQLADKVAVWWKPGPIYGLSLEAWRATFELNATPVMSAARAAVRAMAGKGGSLVIVSSVQQCSQLHLASRRTATRQPRARRWPWSLPWLRPKRQTAFKSMRFFPGPRPPL
ncbi:MAG: SDR family NAD(P)-dependent oxidoreductase [Acidimicrobiia bacterium]|nr:SDR family NAD(P)-dependent oxidoreductase [Acidimicrobiia bacterium]